MFIDGIHDNMSVSDFKMWFAALSMDDKLRVLNSGCKAWKFGVIIPNTEENLRESIEYFFSSDILEVLRHTDKICTSESDFIFLDPYNEDISPLDSVELEDFIFDHFGTWESFADAALHIELLEEE